MAKLDINLPKYVEVGKVVNVLEEIVHNKEEGYSYPFGTRASTSSSPVSAVHYKLTHDRLKQMAKHESIEEKKEEKLKKEWCEDVQLPAKFERHRPAFPEMLTKYKSIWDGQFGRINVSKHHNSLINIEVQLVYTVPNRARPTARQFTAAAINLMTAEKMKR